MMQVTHFLAALRLAAVLLAPGFAWAAGGDQGHDHGEAAPAATAPVITATSGSFELVGRLKAGELSIHIDRADTNAPVLDAQLGLESDGRRASATFHADQGDYAVDDAAMLAHLKTPGVKALVFTLVAGEERELLSGELDVPGEAPADAAAPGPAWTAVAGWGAVALAAIAALAVARRRLNAARALRTGRGA